MFHRRYGTASSVDQWTWSQDAFRQANKTAQNSTEAQQKVASYLQGHFSSFITEDDIRAIVAAGLNTIRIPVGYWAFDTADWEPYPAHGLEMPYLLKALQWAKKYNLDVFLSLHGVPGSQNGYQSSGKQGGVQFAVVNATQNLDRTTNSLKSIVNQLVCQSPDGDVIKSILVMNEPLSKALGQAFIGSTYSTLYDAVSSALDICNLSSERPLINFHDAFVNPVSTWQAYFDNSSFAPGSFTVESHLYQAYAPQNTFTYEQHIAEVQKQGQALLDAQSHFPIHVGEFSLSIGTQYAVQRNASDSSMQTELDRISTPQQNMFYRRFWEAQVSTYESSSSGWIFWTWKTEQSPTWSYQVGLQQGWIPSNPAERVFRTTSAGVVSNKLAGAAPVFQVQTSGTRRLTLSLSCFLPFASIALLVLLP